MDELNIEGKNYISSKRAAALTGYAKDYVGQLCREGRVEARLVGRSWYVYEPSIRKHRFEGGEGVSVVEVSEKEENLKAVPSEITNKEAVFESPTYVVEDVPEIPLITEKEPEPTPVPHVEREEVTVAEIESAWQEWFQKDAVQVDSNYIEEVAEEELQNEASLEEIAPEARESVPEDVPVVPIRLKQPVQKAEFMDIAPVAVERALEPEPLQVRRQVRTTRKNKSSVVVKAIFAAVILLSITVAVIGIGENSANTASVNASGFDLIRFLEGTDIVNSQ